MEKRLKLSDFLWSAFQLFTQHKDFVFDAIEMSEEFSLMNGWRVQQSSLRIIALDVEMQIMIIDGSVEDIKLSQGRSTFVMLKIKLYL